jgi:lysophospholipase L1-like esterase
VTVPSRRIGRVGGAVLQLGAALGVTVVLLSVAEGLARLVVGPAPARPASVAAAHNEDYVATTLTGLDLAPELNPSPLVEDPFVLWWNKPLATKTQPVNPAVFGHPGATWTIENDSEGFRGPERPYRDADDHEVYRILCVGDSVTFGFNVDQPDAYPRRLEALLRERHPGRQIEVVNAGVPGWSSVQGLRFLEAYGLRLRPDLVIAAHGTNDQFWPALVTDRERLPGGGLPAPEMRPPSLLERTAIYRLLARIGRRGRPATEPSPVCKETIARGETCRRVSVHEIETTVAEMHERVRAAGADLVVANLDFMETAAVEGVARAAAARRLPFVDMVDQFRTLQQAEDAALAAELGLRPGGAVRPVVAGEPRRVVFRVLVPPSSDGAVSVRGNGYFPFRDDVHFELPLGDDGTGGDEVPGDRVFSGVLDVGADVWSLEYTFWLGETAEFTPLPPLRSTSGTRLVRLAGEAVTPVARFGERRRMAERTHPNADGQALIAERLTEVVEARPSFRSWAGGS